MLRLGGPVCPEAVPVEPWEAVGRPCPLEVWGGGTGKAGKDLEAARPAWGRLEAGACT